MWLLKMCTTLHPSAPGIGLSQLQNVRCQVPDAAGCAPLQRAEMLLQDVKAPWTAGPSQHVRLLQHISL